MTNAHSGELRSESAYADAFDGLPELDLFEELNVYSGLTPEERERRDRLAYASASSKQPAPDKAQVSDDSGFEVVEMSKTRPLVQRPIQKPAPRPEQVARHSAQLAPQTPAQPPQNRSSQPTPQASSAPGPQCPGCGQTNSEGDLFCEACGTFLDEALSVGAEVEPIVESMCTDCGSPVEKEEIFCPSCGSVMGAD
ncbi:MAG TPA: zinc ribbon domain-containing protein [Blastocatellia bacterium]|nr:zinc ribbon domain-containing protein [Blastocatellia bacterium]